MPIVKISQPGCPGWHFSVHFRRLDRIYVTREACCSQRPITQPNSDRKSVRAIEVLQYCCISGSQSINSYNSQLYLLPMEYSSCSNAFQLFDNKQCLVVALICVSFAVRIMCVLTHLCVNCFKYMLMWWNRLLLPELNHYYNHYGLCYNIPTFAHSNNVHSNHLLFQYLLLHLAQRDELLYGATNVSVCFRTMIVDNKAIYKTTNPSAKHRQAENINPHGMEQPGKPI